MMKISILVGTTLKKERKIKNIECEQLDFQKIVPFFEQNFESYGDKRNIERQRYRMLYEKIIMFQSQFKMLKYRKNQDVFELSNSALLEQSNYCKVCLLWVYTIGKEIVDIMGILNISIKDESIVKKFVETRNKIFEHGIKINKNKVNTENLEIFEINYSDVTNSDWYVAVNLHWISENNKTYYINYCEDYMTLEKNIFEKLTLL